MEGETICCDKSIWKKMKLLVSRIYEVETHFPIQWQPAVHVG